MTLYFKYDKSREDILVNVIWLLTDLIWVSICIYILVLTVEGGFRNILMTILGLLLFSVPLIHSIHDRLLLKVFSKVDEDKEIEVDYERKAITIKYKNGQQFLLMQEDILDIEIWDSFWRKNIFFNRNGFYKINLINRSCIIVTKLTIEEKSLLNVVDKEKIRRNIFYWYSRKKELQPTFGLAKNWLTE